MGCSDELAIKRMRIPVDSPADHFNEALTEMMASLGLTMWDFSVRILDYSGNIDIAMGLQYAKCVSASQSPRRRPRAGYCGAYAG